jgi:hypothetical protein
MQCHVNGVVINNTPKICNPNPDSLVHAIEVNDPLDLDAKLHVPLLLHGVSCFNVNVCCPSTDKLEDEDIPKINMMYASHK